MRSSSSPDLSVPLSEILSRRLAITASHYRFVSLSRSQRLKQAERTEELPKVIYLETLVLCDTEYFSSARVHNLYDPEYYLGLYFNSVNQRFNDVRGVKIRFLPVDIIKMNKSEEANVFVLHERKNKRYVNATATLPKLREYAKNLSNFTKVDAVLLLTSQMTFYHDPEVPNDTERPLVTITPGDAYQGGVCTGNKVAISQDNGKFFTGVDNTARQLARLIGATLDLRSVRGECNYYQSYLMGTFWTESQHHYQFSNCSSWAIRLHLSNISNWETCFKRNFNSSASEKVPKLAPGSIYNTVETYCRLVVNTYDMYKVYACQFPKRGDFYDRYFDNCNIRCCTYWGPFYWWFEDGPFKYPAPDGMTCGYQKRHDAQTGHNEQRRTWPPFELWKKPLRGKRRRRKSLRMETTMRFWHVCRNRQCVGTPRDYIE